MTATTPPTPSRLDDESGVALFYSLLVAVVVAGIVAVVFATTLTESDQARFELNFEDTIHVAEAGAEVYLARLTEDADLTSAVDGPETTGEDPSTWALRVATQQTVPGTFDFDVIDTGEGETVALRPQGDDAEYVYGVGFTPSRDAFLADTGEPYARVVRVQVAFSPSDFEGDFALLAGGNVTMSGNYKVYGDAGAVHTNGAISRNGSGTVERGISYSGSCTKGCNSTVTGPVDSVPIERVDVRDTWGTDDAITVAGEGDWYDYCSGVWRQRAPGDTAPCQGTVVSAPSGWGGTTYNNPATPSDHVYYFAGGEDLDVKKLDGNITIITDGSIDVGPSANLPPFDARYPGLLLLAGGDIEIGGNSDSFAATNPALVFANGNIELSGTMQTNEVAFVARDSTNIGTSYKGGGSGSVTYNGGAIADLGGDGYPIVLQWDEVR